MPIKEYRHSWKDWKGCECECDIQIFDGQGDYAGMKIVIATDINIGNSVTNEIESIGTDVCRNEAINPLDLVLIEHYDHTGNKPSKFDETFDLVKLHWNERDKKFNDPDWKHFTKEETEQIIGEQLS